MGGKEPTEGNTGGRRAGLFVGGQTSTFQPRCRDTKVVDLGNGVYGGASWDVCGTNGPRFPRFEGTVWKWRDGQNVPAEQRKTVTKENGQRGRGGKHWGLKKKNPSNFVTRPAYGRN